MTMRILFAAAAAALLATALPAAGNGGSNLGAVTGGDVRPEQRLIEDKCLGCHNEKRIKEARKQQKNMEAILQLMEKKGVVLTDRDREVLQHFWKAKAFKD
jgi:hypothetical protein